MYILFFIFVIGVIAVIPLHFLSVEHTQLKEKYGAARERKIGEICSFLSGWGFFVFWAGLWFSPQPKFIVPIFSNLSVVMPFVNFSISIVDLLVFVPLFLLGAWLGIAGVKETTLKVAETHRAERIVTSGVYSSVRHPQYLGGLLAHVGISFLFSAWYSLLSTPLMVLLVFLISRKEENELVKEFGKEYKDYAKKVPMFLPKVRKKQ